MKLKRNHPKEKIKKRINLKTKKEIKLRINPRIETEIKKKIKSLPLKIKLLPASQVNLIMIRVRVIDQVIKLIDPPQDQVQNQSKSFVSNSFSNEATL